MDRVKQLNKFFIVGGISIILLGVLLVLWWGKPTDELPSSTDTYVVEFRYQTNEKTIEIRNEVASGMSWLYENGEKLQLSSPLKKAQAKEMMTLPDVDELVEWDGGFLYNQPLETSIAMYLDLKNKGYQDIVHVATTTHLEWVVEKEEKRIRLLVYPNHLLIGEIGFDIALPSLEDYLDN